MLGSVLPVLGGHLSLPSGPVHLWPGRHCEVVRSTCASHSRGGGWSPSGPSGHTGRTLHCREPAGSAGWPQGPNPKARGLRMAPHGSDWDSGVTVLSYLHYNTGESNSYPRAVPRWAVPRWVVCKQAVAATEQRRKLPLTGLVLPTTAAFPPIRCSHSLMEGSFASQKCDSQGRSLSGKPLSRSVHAEDHTRGHKRCTVSVTPSTWKLVQNPARGMGWGRNFSSGMLAPPHSQGSLDMEKNCLEAASFCSGGKLPLEETKGPNRIMLPGCGRAERVAIQMELRSSGAGRGTGR